MKAVESYGIWRMRRNGRRGNERDQEVRDYNPGLTAAKEKKKKIVRKNRQGKSLTGLERGQMFEKGEMRWPQTRTWPCFKSRAPA